MSRSISMPVDLNVFFVNMANHPTFKKHTKYILEYCNAITKFIPVYLLKRYNIKIDSYFYFPVYTPKNYPDLQQWDKTHWRDQYFGKSVQLYCGYGLALNPHDAYRDKGIQTVGYCECHNYNGNLKPEDMNYADMNAYDPMSVVQGIASFYYGFSRIVFHELDHQVGRLLNAKWFISGVHKAANKPLEWWSPDGSVKISETDNSASLKQFPLDSKGNMLFFPVQVDPRTV